MTRDKMTGQEAMDFAEFQKQQRKMEFVKQLILLQDEMKKHDFRISIQAFEARGVQMKTNPALVIPHLVVIELPAQLETEQEA